jgi:MSHA biogenesis protein MshO
VSLQPLPPVHPGPYLRRQRGVTLVELVAVIVILGVVASVAARLMAVPIQTLMSGGANAQLAEQVSQATRRLEEDLSRALGNSVRVTTGTAGGETATFIEMVPVHAVGRYRKLPAASGPAGNPLDFGDPLDASFDVLGPFDGVPGGASLVIHNLGTTDADVYLGNNRRGGVAFGSGTLSFTPAGAFPIDSPSGRFAIVGSPVTWMCRAAADGSGTLVRFSGYAIQTAQPADAEGAPLSGAQQIVAARGVSGCTVRYEVAPTQLGLLQLNLELASGGDATARLAQQYALDNTP